MKNAKRILSILLVLFMLIQYLPGSIIVFAANDTIQYNYSSQYNSGKRNEVATTLNGTNADAYYDGSYEFDVLSAKSATEIFNSLQTLMRSTHSYLSTYDDCHYKANRTDCELGQGEGSSDSNRYLSLIYTSYKASLSQWNGWNGKAAIKPCVYTRWVILCPISTNVLPCLAGSCR